MARPPRKTYQPCARGCLGWFYSQGNTEGRIERCDECKRFESDDDAAEFVHRSYRRLLRAAGAGADMLQRWLDQFGELDAPERRSLGQLTRAIREAKGAF